MSLISFIFYILHQHHILSTIHLIGALLLGISSISFSMSTKFAHPSYRRIRAIVFTIFGLYGIIPTVNWLLLDHDKFGFNLNLQLIFKGFIIMSCLYFIGAGLYATRFPERFFPGKCDLYLQSHQIFHILVTSAACIHYHGLILLVDYVRSTQSQTKELEVH